MRQPALVLLINLLGENGYLKRGCLLKCLVDSLSVILLFDFHRLTTPGEEDHEVLAFAIITNIVIFEACWTISQSVLIV